MRYRYSDIEMVANGIFYYSESREDFICKIDELFNNEFNFGLVVTNYMEKYLPQNEFTEEVIIRLWAYHKPCDICGKLGKLYKKPNEIGMLRNCPDCIHHMD